MTTKSFEFKIKTDYTPEELDSKVYSLVGSKIINYQIVRKSLDGRDHKDIHWLIKVDIFDGKTLELPQLEIPKVKEKKTVVVVGYGPAGFFAAYLLALGGMKVHVLELGPEVHSRIKDVKLFEKGGPLNSKSNYAYGEGGAGTFSDGKLTSRTKSIVLERQFIFNEYVNAGAPEEIKYLSKPHIGSNLLVKTVKNLRKKLLQLDAEIHFDTPALSIIKQNDNVTAIETGIGKIDCDYVVFATGHTSLNSYKMLLDSGAKFTIKPFAIGSRVEHNQSVINISKWNQTTLPGVKSADYALTFNQSPLPVYSFCMCPGGMVVPAAPEHGQNLVNGMSNYKRNYPFANSAIVAAINLNEMYDKEFDTLEALEWVTNLERKFYDFAGGYSAPAVIVSDFLKKKKSTAFPETSYPLGLVTGDLDYLLPKSVVESQRKALYNFSKKIRGFEDGVLMGLESRTSSPVQALRNRNGKLDGIDNLYFVGEGSGYSGGIVSSAADGIKAAIEILNREQ